ncbi:hypothetical protein [Nocardia altamirensis]|uniref:hypothetical protein n=1 Tax=Nocardia altamirensis TaxID=472158 RepID=UPI00114CD22D|nr:hypothetical protein [Nocardia altamirensis]
MDVLIADESLNTRPASAAAEPTTQTAPAQKSATTVSETSERLKTIMHSEAPPASGRPGSTAQTTQPETDANDDDPFDRSLRTPEIAVSDDAETTTDEQELSGETAATTPSKSRSWRTVSASVRPRWNALSTQKKVVTAGIITLVVLACLTLIIRASTDETTTPNPYIVAPKTGTATAGLPAPNPDAPADHTIKPASVAARCPAGSTDPTLAFDTDPATAWMCVRVYGIDGQVLTIKLDHPYVITRMSIIPGWLRQNSDGSDEWIKHRVVTKLRYTFDDPAHTSIEQPTQNTRDEVVTAITPPVLASTVQITIQSTTAPTGAEQQGPGMNVGPTPTNNTNSSDFAVSSITITGHSAS